MRALVFAVASLFLAAPLAAQVYPSPSAQSPRIQEITWQQGQSFSLTVLPESHLTVLLEPGEVIRRAVINDGQSWDVAVSADQDSLTVKPNATALPTQLLVETDAREYRFDLEIAQSLLAAYLVRFIPDQGSEAFNPAIAPPIDRPSYSYRLRGDKSVRPASITDNGEKTIIEYAEGQSLPAVFAIGPTGDEEVVDGYMRDGRFVIDRVHQELVFRIDKKKARARRNKDQDQAL